MMIWYLSFIINLDYRFYYMFLQEILDLSPLLTVFVAIQLKHHSNSLQSLALMY